MAAVALVGAAVSAGVASSGGIASAVSSATVVGGGTEGGGAVASTLAMAQGGQTTAATGAGAFFKMASVRSLTGVSFRFCADNVKPNASAGLRRLDTQHNEECVVVRGPTLHTEAWAICDERLVWRCYCSPDADYISRYVETRNITGNAS